MADGRVGVALAGVGRWGRNLARVLVESPRADVLYLCDPSASALGRAPASCTARRSSTLGTALADPAVGAVLIATPPDTHAELCLASLAAGKHVFVEKPMVTSVEDAERIVFGAEQARRQLMIGHILLRHPAFKELVRLVKGGAIGALRRIRCERLGPAASDDALGTWWALAPHDIAMCRRLVGDEPLGIEVGRRAGGVIEGTMEFVGGVTVELTLGCGVKTRRLTAIGDRGWCVFDDLETWPNKLRLGTTVGAGPIETTAAHVTIPGAGAEPLALELDGFLLGLLGGGAPSHEAPDGLGITRVLEQGVRQLRVRPRTTDISDARSAARSPAPGE